MNATLPPGRYYIGDPCYVFDESWDDVLTATDFFDKNVQTFRGVPVFGHSTAYGDGAYHGSNGREYGVDAGLLGAIPEQLFDNQPDDNGPVIDAPQGLRCSYSDGVFYFHVIGANTIEIDTDPDEGDEYDEDFDEDED